MSVAPIIDLEFYDHQETFSIDLEAIHQATIKALPLVLQHPGPEESNLKEGGSIEFSFVNDAVIAKVHADFLDDPTPTDVITFQHGEILISTETAARQGAEHGQPLQQELTLYAIHGLLHLHGHEDHTEAGAATMKSLQELILQQVAP
jgi:probable rRNA maturation factor